MATKAVAVREAGIRRMQLEDEMSNASAQQAMDKAEWVVQQAPNTAKFVWLAHDL